MNPYRNHGYRRGVLGCALSHLMIWRDMANDEALEEHDMYIILEDDLQISKRQGSAGGAGEAGSAGHGRSTLARWNLALSSARDDPSWDWIYLAYWYDSPYNEGGGLHDDMEIHPGIKQFRTQEDYGPHDNGNGLPFVVRSFGGSTCGYVLRKRGAKRLLAAAQTHGIDQPIDWFMMEEGFGRAGKAGVEGGRDVGQASGTDVATPPRNNAVYHLSPLLLKDDFFISGASDTVEYYPETEAVEEAIRTVQDRRSRRACNTSQWHSHYKHNTDNTAWCCGSP